jgi:hypothetical protein
MDGLQLVSVSEVAIGRVVVCDMIAFFYFLHSFVLISNVSPFFVFSCTVCPQDTNLENCQDITSSIGIYLSSKPNSSAGSGFEDSTTNLSDTSSSSSSTKKIIDPSTLTSELQAFQVSMEEAITNNRLQEIVESLYSGINAEPPVFVLPTQVTSTIVSSGGSDEDDNQNDSNNDNIGIADEGDGAGSETGESSGGGDSGSAGDGDGESNNTIEDEEGDSNGVDNAGDDDEIENIQIGTGGGEGEFAPESGNEWISGGTDSQDGGSSNGNAGSDGGNSSGSWLPDPSDTSPSTNGGGDTLPAITDNTLNRGENQNSLTMGGIIGVVLVALAAVMIIVSLIYLRRPSRTNRNDDEPSRRSGSPLKRKGKKKTTKSLAADVDEVDMVSSDSSRKNSLGRFLYSGVQGQSMLESSHSRGGTDHSRGTVPTVTSTMSENTDASVSTAAAEGGRGTEAWKKDEIMVPLNTTRGLLTLDSVDEEKRSEDECDPNDPLLGSNKNLAPTSSSEFEAQARDRVADLSDEEEVYNSDSAGSSGWSSNNSPSTVESPLKAMAVRSIAALRKGRRESRNRSIQRSKQELENVLSTDDMRDENAEEKQEVVGQVALGGNEADDESSPMKKKEDERTAINSPGVASADGSYGSAISDIRPLSSLDEAIMKGDWAAVSSLHWLFFLSILVVCGSRDIRCFFMCRSEPQLH